MQEKAAKGTAEREHFSNSGFPKVKPRQPKQADPKPAEPVAGPAATAVAA